MLFEIPAQLDTTPYQQFVELSGETYSLSMRFNRRSGFWFMSLSLNDVDLISDLKLVHSFNILDEYRHIESLPPGDLILMDKDGKFIEPGEGTFGDRVVFLYDEG